MPQTAAQRPAAADQIEADLSAIGASEGFPPTPDLAAGVRARIEEEGIRPGPARWPLFGVPVGRSAVLALVGLLALAGTVIAATIVIGGLRIRFVEELPTVPATASTGTSQEPGPGSSLALGRRLGLEEARAAVPFPIRIPSDARLGPPDAVYHSVVPETGMISLVWGERPGLPEAANGVAILLTEFQAGLEPDTFEKLVHSGSTVRPTSVGDAQAYWISGEPHAFLYRDATGEIHEHSLRLVGSTLVWEDEDIVFRIEGAPSLDDALRIATSIR